MICGLGFGLQVRQLGFYWDDYASLYVYQEHGAEVFAEWSGGQARLVAGYVLTAMWDTFGANPTPWHILNFALYGLSVLLFWGILRCVWPQHRTQTTLTALLFAVYPSYHLRPIPISLVIVLSLAVCLLSFYLTCWAVTRRNIPLAVVAATLIPIYQLMYEQNLAYEALRPLLILYMLGSWRPRVWWPFVLPAFTVATALAVYRFVLFEPNSTYATYNEPFYLKSVEGWLLIFKYGVAAPAKMLVWDWWGVPWRVFAIESIDVDFPGLAAILALIACLFYLWRHQDQHFAPKRETLGIAVIGFLMTSLLLFFVHAVGRVVTDGFDSRWALTPSLMLALILGWGLPRLLRSAALGYMVLATLIALGVAVQVGVNEAYIADWQLRQSLGWQMRWRAPSLQSGTMVAWVTDKDSFAFDRALNDYELTAHFNLYYPDETNYPLIVGAEPAMVGLILADSLPHSGQWSETISGRDIIFRGWDYDLSKLIVFGYDGGCLITADSNTTLQLSNQVLFQGLAPLHQSGQILMEDGLAPLSVAGEEPAHEWCYYYQRVQWALQFKSPPDAADIADQTVRLGFSPSVGHEREWLPFILAYQAAGRLDSAQPLIYRLLLADTDNYALYCAYVDDASKCSP